MSLSNPVGLTEYLSAEHPTTLCAESLPDWRVRADTAHGEFVGTAGQVSVLDLSAVGAVEGKARGVTTGDRRFSV